MLPITTLWLAAVSAAGLASATKKSAGCGSGDDIPDLEERITYDLKANESRSYSKSLQIPKTHMPCRVCCFPCASTAALGPIKT